MALIKYFSKSDLGFIDKSKSHTIARSAKEDTDLDIEIIDLQRDSATGVEVAMFVGDVRATLVPNDDVQIKFLPEEEYDEIDLDNMPERESSYIKEFESHYENKPYAMKHFIDHYRGRVYSAMRFKVYWRRGRDSEYLLDNSDVLVKTEYPWSNCVLGQANFKGRYRRRGIFEKPAIKRINQLIAKLEPSFSDNPVDREFLISAIFNQALSERTQEVTFDPWDNDKRAMTASIFRTNNEKTGKLAAYRITNLAGKQASYNAQQKAVAKKAGLGPSDHKAPVVEKECSDLVCIVRNYEKVVANLSYMDSEVAKLLEQAESGTLRTSYDEGLGQAVAHRGFAEVKEEYMALSIKQALGGPYDSSQWFINGNKKVSSLVALIFKCHAKNYTRHILDQEKEFAE